MPKEQFWKLFIPGRGGGNHPPSLKPPFWYVLQSLFLQEVRYAYGWNLPGSTSLLGECHQIMCKADVLKEMHESFCVLSMKGRLLRICKNIFKKVSQKTRNFQLKIGYNSGCNIKYQIKMVTKSLISPQQKHGSSRNCKFKLINDYQIYVCKDLCTHGTTRCVNVHAHI